MPINSRQKGKRGELELCHTLRELFGWVAERSVQHCGNAGDSDLIVRNLPKMFVECKRVEQLNLSKAMDLARQQAGQKVPVIFHRRDREEWMASVPLDRLMELAVMMTERHTQQEQCDPISASDTTSFPPPGLGESRRPWPWAQKTTAKETG